MFASDPPPGAPREGGSRRRRWRGAGLSLDRIFLLWLLVVTVITMALVGLLVLRHQQRFLENQLLERGRHLARVIGEVVARQGVATALSMAEVGEVLAVEVQDRRGAVVWRYGPALRDIESAGGGGVRVEVEVEAPAPAAGESPFHVVVWLSKGPMLRHLAASAARLLGGLYLALALSLILGLWLITRVVRPIRELARRARTFDPDHPEVETMPRGVGAEVAELGAAFDEMWSRLAEQRRALRASEEERRAAIGALAGGVAHDFNNLLAGILLHVRWLERDPEALGHASTAIRDLAEEGAEVIRELLVVSRRETTPMEVVDLADLISRQEAVLRHLLPHGVEMRLAVASDPVVVRANPVALRRLVLNLVLNARDAVSAGGGTVEVEVDTEGGVARIVVADDGEGIDPELQERLFEPFFSLRREGRGAGLGLAVVEAVVAEHGGELSVDSAPGRGTRITVHLPLCESEVHDPGAGSAADAAGSADRRILVVHGDGLVAARLMEQLSIAGFASRHAANLADASRQFGVWMPDAVVVDLGLLETTAASFVAELQRPVVLIPGRDGPRPEIREEGSTVVCLEDHAGRGLVEALRGLTDPGG